jgi:ABC-type glycerol-3-phosphate transport system substrate-binding protein
MSTTLQQRRVSRRQFLTYVGLASGAAALAACQAPAAPAAGGATPEAAAAATGQQTVQFYTLVWQAGAVEATQKAVADWNAANEARIKVEYIQGAWGNARDYLTTSIAGGVTPDIVHGITAWANEYGTQGAYVDLTDYLADTELKADIHPKALDAAISPLNNKIYAIPWCWEVGVMFVNADRLTEAGIELPTEGWTWDTFVADAKKVTNPPEYYALAANLSATQTTEDIIAWMWQTGAEVMGQIGGEWVIDVDKARPALSLWNDMIWKDEILSQDSFAGANTHEAFTLGIYTCLQSGCYGRGDITAAQPDFTWRMVPLPYQARKANSSEPQTWSMATDSVTRNTAAAAWEVIDWLSNNENSSNIAYGDWLLPTRQSAMQDERFTTTELDWNIAQQEVENGHAYPKHPAWAEFDDRVLGPNIQKYLQNELSLDALIDTLQTEGEKLLSQYEI